MATSVFFNNFKQSAEQNLLEDLITESIQIYGHDCYYLPRTLVNVDPVFQEEEVSRFNSAYLIEMYITNIEGFGGDGEFLSKFNLEIRDRLTFVMSKRRFFEELEDVLDNKRPKEGDLVYMPMTGTLYEVHFVEQEHAFYQLGRLNSFALVCEQFTYSNEEFNTGIPVIDNIGKVYTTVISEDVLIDSDGNPILSSDGSYILTTTTPIQDQDPLSENEDFDNLADDIIDFTPANPFSEA